MQGGRDQVGDSVEISREGGGAPRGVVQLVLDGRHGAADTALLVSPLST